MRIEIGLKDLLWLVLLVLTLIAARAAPRTGNWEYFAVSHPYVTRMEETLNERDKEGWELASCFITPDQTRNLVTCILKRSMP